LVLCPVVQDIVGKPGLIWLVDVEHINLIVPGPRVQSSRIGVDVDIARACPR
jgi:hypothetical protein